MKKLTIQKKQLEFIPALFNLLWGFWLISPWWNAFSSSTAFTLMSNIADRYVWGAFVGIVGLFQMVSLFTDKLKVRAWASLLSVFILILLSVIFAFGNFRSTATINYAVIAICAWLGFTEILSDIKDEKEETWK